MIIVDQPDRCGRWLAEKQQIEYCKDESAIYIGLENKNELKVVIMYCGYIKNGSIQMHLAIDGRGNKDILNLAYSYPFNQLNVNKIIAPIQSNNKKCLMFALKAGFTLEHTIKDAGVNCDLLILTMTKKQCRFLKK